MLVVDPEEQPVSDPRQVRLARVCHELHPLLRCRHGEGGQVKFLEHFLHFLPGGSMRDLREHRAFSPELGILLRLLLIARVTPVFLSLALHPAYQA